MENTPSELTARNFPSAQDDARRVPDASRYAGPGSSYKLAFSDADFLLREELRPVRMPLDVQMLADWYLQGRLKLDELISARYPLEQINEAIASAAGGEALRNVITF